MRRWRKLGLYTHVMRHLLRGLTTAALVVAVSGCSVPLVRSVQDSEFEEISRVFRDGDYEDAAAQLESYVGRYPDDALAWTLLGHARLELDQPRDAGEAYDAALALDPVLVEALTARGVAHRINGDYDKAMAFYQVAVLTDPDYAEAWSSMAALELLQYRDDEALEHARKAYELAPNDAVVLANLAVALHYNGFERERDEMARLAGELDYRGMEALQQIFSGTVDIRDDS